jgi:hypothetical protein
VLVPGPLALLGPQAQPVAWLLLLDQLQLLLEVCHLAPHGILQVRL